MPENPKINLRIWILDQEPSDQVLDETTGECFVKRDALALILPLGAYYLAGGDYVNPLDAVVERIEYEERTNEIFLNLKLESAGSFPMEYLLDPKNGWTQDT